MFCRLAAQELSLLAPTLSNANVRLVGVGLEPLGVEEFVERKFWDGELYIDEKKKSFQDLGFKRFSLLSLPRYLLSKIARDATSKGKERNLGGDLKGDAFQNGGLLVVEKGGKVLYSFIQENPADHAQNEDILKALKLTFIEGSSSTSAEQTAAASSCDGDVCGWKPKSEKN
jgi:prostamide/prostaglandin F2alpha synthase